MQRSGTDPAADLRTALLAAVFPSWGTRILLDELHVIAAKMPQKQQEVTWHLQWG